MTEIVTFVARPFVAGEIACRGRPLVLGALLLLGFLAGSDSSVPPGGWAEVRGLNLSTTCSSSEIMGRWVFTAPIREKSCAFLSTAAALPT